jgi:hypothetical protein
MPDMSGLEVLKEIGAMDPSMTVITFSGTVARCWSGRFGNLVPATLSPKRDQF